VDDDLARSNEEAKRNKGMSDIEARARAETETVAERRRRKDREAKRKLREDPATARRLRIQAKADVRQFTNMMYRLMSRRVRKLDGYKGLPILPRDQFRAWILADATFARLHAEWIASDFHPTLTPSVDRIDPRQGYLLPNMRVLTHIENSARSHPRAPIAMTADFARQIVSEANSGQSTTQLMLKWRLCRQTINCIKRGVRWGRATADLREPSITKDLKHE
jgi:hypothetical protein